LPIKRGRLKEKKGPKGGENKRDEEKKKWGSGIQKRSQLWGKKHG